MENFSAVHCQNNKKKNKDKPFFTLARDGALAKVKLNREKDNLQKNV